MLDEHFYWLVLSTFRLYQFRRRFIAWISIFSTVKPVHTKKLFPNYFQLKFILRPTQPIRVRLALQSFSNFHSIALSNCQLPTGISNVKSITHRFPLLHMMFNPPIKVCLKREFWFFGFCFLFGNSSFCFVWYIWEHSFRIWIYFQFKF